MAATPRKVELSVGAIVVDDQQRLLLVQRGRPPAVGEWSVPGGRVEPGETMAEAVVREVEEETGLVVFCGELAGYVEKITDEYHFVIFDFFASTLDPVPPVPGDDAAAAEWVPLAEVENRPLVRGLAEFLFDTGVISELI
ncbi:MAG: NUDIX domain-containing protein [Acidimicrobiia bacterium]